MDKKILTKILRFFEISPMVLMIFLIANHLSCKTLKPNSEATLKNATSDSRSLNLEVSTEDIDVPYPIQVLLSLTQGSPVFTGNEGVITSVRYNKRAGVDRVAVAIDALNDKLKEVLTIENGGSTSITVQTGFVSRAGSTPSTMHKFHGVCINGSAYILGALNISGDDEDYHISNLGKMPPTYRPDLKTCRERFLELVNIKYREKHQAKKNLDAVETLNFMFYFLPGYAGAESLSNDNVFLGTAEIVADIATLGISSKYKAGWNSLRMSKRMFQTVEKGLMISAISANAARLGSVIKSVAEHGGSIRDIPSVALLVAETGFVLMHVKVKLRSNKKISEFQNISPGTKAVIYKSEDVIELQRVLELKGVKTKYVKTNDVGGALEVMPSGASELNIFSDYLQSAYAGIKVRLVPNLSARGSYNAQFHTLQLGQEFIIDLHRGGKLGDISTIIRHELVHARLVARNRLGKSTVFDGILMPKNGFKDNYVGFYDKMLPFQEFATFGWQVFYHLRQAKKFGIKGINNASEIKQSISRIREYKVLLNRQSEHMADISAAISAKNFKIQYGAFGDLSIATLKFPGAVSDIGFLVPKSFKKLPLEKQAVQLILFFNEARKNAVIMKRIGEKFDQIEAELLKGVSPENINVREFRKQFQALVDGRIGRS